MDLSGANSIMKPLRMCADCRQKKPMTEFSPTSYYCRPCWNLRAKAYRKKNPNCRVAVDRWRSRNRQKVRDARRRRGYKERHDISLEDFERMFDAQNGVCANIGCGRVLTTVSHKFNSAVADHDHKTGRLRGILCQACNFGLGQFEDDVLRLHGIIAYLEKYTGK